MSKEIPANRDVAPKIGSYDSHGEKTRAPQAARFDRGASSMPEIVDAINQRREHNSNLSDPGRKGWKKQSPNS
jgi:hypothetical protein